MAYDIIGDIHGHIDTLVALLESMGYRDEGGVYRCSGRQVVFVGDLIDRGPGQREVTALARAMVEDGSARAVMGNHEFNALAWDTEDPDNPGTWLRPHTEDKHRQHEAFLEAWADDPRGKAATLDWFRTLPLFLELDDGSRVIHACWHEPSMAAIRDLLGPGDTLTPKLLLAASRRGSAPFEAIEVLLKGPEVSLPEGMVIYDKQGTPRPQGRLAWWRDAPQTYGEAIFPHPRRASPELLAMPLSQPLPTTYPTDAPRVFFGHYWIPAQGAPEPLRENVYCLDYSVARGGWLCAARLDNGEVRLHHVKAI